MPNVNRDPIIILARILPTPAFSDQLITISVAAQDAVVSPAAEERISKEFYSGEV